MFTRSLSRWIIALVIAVAMLTVINTLLTQPTAQARHTATTTTCLGSIQACINAAVDGDTILIPAGTYTESLTLSKAVSLTGENRDTTIIHAVTVQRVLTVTGAAIDHSVVISGLTFTGGDATNGQGTIIFLPPTIVGPTPTPTATPTPGSQHTSHSTPIPQNLIYANAAGRSIPISWQTRHSLQDFDPARDGVGGGILITDSARPELQSIRVISNIAGYGGGLYIGSNNSLTLTHADIVSNVAVYGGGLLAYSPLTVLQADLSNNYAVGVGGGAQISGAAVVLNSHVAHNEGGGLHVEGSLTLQNTDVSFNNAGAFMGDNGITIFSGTLILNDATIEGNHGEGFRGGIFADDSRVWITNTRFLRNSAYEGGGLNLYNGSSGRVANSVFAQNSSAYGGASIETWGDLQIIHTTIADTGLNPGPAIYFDIGSLFITDTLIASHTIGIQRSPFATGVHEDYNLFFGNTTDRVGVTTGTYSLNGDPLFVDPTRDDYHLRFGSAAIDHGIDADITTDFDGNPRPSGAGFDIGAYEFQNGTRYVATTGMDAGNNCLAEAAPCATVQRAVDVANEGEKVVIASGLYTQSTTLYKPVSLTGVNSATTILHAVEGQRVLTVTGATISNSVVISGLTFTGGSADYGGGMLITDTAQPLIRDSSFISNAANVGGGQYSSNAVTLINTDFISNTANLLGGGVHAFGEPVNITGGRFEANTGVSGGGLSAGGTVTLTNVDFIRNTASTGPGGALIGQGSVVSGGRFVENSAESIGGLSAGSNLIIAGTEFLSNTARTGAGGGLLVSALGTVVITGAQFENNYAGDSGGGLLVADIDVTPINTRFISNTSTREGGGVLLNNSKMAWISGGRFERNTATNGGGGVYAGFAAITDTEFINNTNTGEGFEGSGGGGLYSRYDPTIINSRFVGNQCVNCKGGGFHTLGNSIISGTAFIDNSATNGGGGAYTSRASIENSRFQRNTSANAEGGGLNAWILSVSSSQFISNSGGSGGGIFAGDLTYPSSLAVTRTVFSENSATRGGGLYVIGTAIITDAKFTNNSTAYQGGAIDFYRGQGRLINTLFVRNSAPVGAAISFESPENIAILHGTIVNPTSTTDSAIAVLSGTLNITNTIITNHAIAIGNTGGTVYEDYNLFFGNVTNTLGVTNGGHSLIGDPRFVDPADGDYHLRLSSPAIDHGVDAGVTTDLDGHPRPIGAGFDIGAYEYQGAITHVFLPLMRK